MLAGAILALAGGSQAQQVAGVNLLTDPAFYVQTPTFQSDGGPYAAGWDYRPDFAFFFPGNGPLDLVSQTISTADLYYYNINFSLNTSDTAPGAEFAVFWNDSKVTQLWELTPTAAWVNYSFEVTAHGSSSDFGVLGNSIFWADMSQLSVSWNGSIDPPPSAPDSPLGLGLETAVLLGLCGAAGLYRRPEFCLQRCTK